MASVDSNFNFLCGRPHGAGPPVHMPPPEPDPLPSPCGRHKWMAPYFYRASSSPLLLRSAPDTVPEFHVEAPQTTVSEGLTKGRYVAARAGVEPMTLRTKGGDSINAPPTGHG